jgi:hypothetical protein
MPDDVVVGIGADAKKAEQAFDKMSALIAKQGAQIEILSKKAVKGARDSSSAWYDTGNSLESFATKAIGVTTVLGGIKSVLNAIAEKAKEIKNIRDDVSTTKDQALRKLFVEGDLKTVDQQNKFEALVLERAKRKGASIQNVAEIYRNAFNQGFSEKDIAGGAVDSTIDLGQATGSKDYGKLLELQQTILAKKKLPETAENMRYAAQVLAKMGGDIDEGETLFSRASDKITPEKMVIYFEAMKKQKGGSKKQAVSVLNDALDGEGEAKLRKLSGLSKDEVDRISSEMRSSTELESKANIARGGYEAQTNRLDVLKVKAYDLRGEMRDKDKIEAKQALAEMDKENYYTRKMETIVADKMRAVGFSEDTAENVGTRLYHGGHRLDEINRSRSDEMQKELGLSSYLNSQEKINNINAFDKSINKAEDNKTVK